MTIIAPSILAADWGRFHDEVSAATSAGADWIHIDVMDGHFVPPITFGPGVVKAARKATKLPLDVHLMIEKPDLQLEAFAQAGADHIIVHLEACTHLHRTIQRIHELKCKAGVAINPSTPVELVRDVIGDIDILLIMTVNPGWGGQKYIKASEKKIAEAAALVMRSGRKIHITVDGGINAETAAISRKAGADVMVAGTYVFEQKDYAQAVKSLR